MTRARVRRSIHVEAQPEDVYDFALGDLSSLSDWMTSVENIESADDKWPAVGASYVYNRNSSGQTIRGRTSVLAVDRPRRFELREDLMIDDPEPPGGQTEDRLGKSIWTFEPEGNGTKVSMEVIGVEMRRSIYLLWRLLVAGRVERNAETTLSRLKKICEEELEDSSE